ncbi:hypothetical protein [Paenibacillus sp. NRS-1760]|uniref:hypothetical protein n=1 Tax=Paenibacillus sp. NRS-1760 TaxID=3233902 RepID=UPI003D2C4A72
MTRNNISEPENGNTITPQKPSTPNPAMARLYVDGHMRKDVVKAIEIIGYDASSQTYTTVDLFGRQNDTGDYVVGIQLEKVIV